MYVCSSKNVISSGVMESHVAAYSALAEREHLYRERCLVVVAVVEEAATIHTHTIPTHTYTHTPSLPGRENAQRARVEERGAARRALRRGAC